MGNLFSSDNPTIHKSDLDQSLNEQQKTFQTFQNSIPSTYISKTDYNKYVSETAPKTYTNLSDFQTLHSSLPAMYTTQYDYNKYVSETAPNTYAKLSEFQTLQTSLPTKYTTQTDYNNYVTQVAPNTYAKLSQLNSLQTTLPTTYINKNDFNSFQSDLPNTYVKQNDFQTFQKAVPFGSFALLKSNDPNQICTLFDNDVKCFKVENPTVPTESIVDSPKTLGEYRMYKRISDMLIIYKIIKGDLPIPNTPLCISSVEQDEQSSLHTLVYSTNPKMLDMIMLGTNYNIDEITRIISNNFTEIKLKQSGSSFVIIGSPNLTDTQKIYIINTYKTYYNTNCIGVPNPVPNPVPTYIDA